MKQVMADFVAWLESEDDCTAQASILFRFSPANAIPIEVTVEISVFGVLYESASKGLASDLFLALLSLLLVFM